MAQATDWGTPKDIPPQLRGDCERQVLTVEPQESVGNERQEQEQVLPERKAGSWFSRMRT